MLHPGVSNGEKVLYTLSFMSEEMMASTVGVGERDSLKCVGGNRKEGFKDAGLYVDD